MLIKCKACNVGFYKIKVDKNNFFCDSCLKSNFAVNQSIQTVNYNSVIVKLQNKVEEQEKMITMLLEQQKKFSQSFISRKSEKINQVTDAEEVYEEELKQDIEIKSDALVSIKVIVVYFFIVSLFLIWFFKEELMSFYNFQY